MDFDLTADHREQPKRRWTTKNILIAQENWSNCKKLTVMPVTRAVLVSDWKKIAKSLDELESQRRISTFQIILLLKTENV